MFVIDNECIQQSFPTTVLFPIFCLSKKWANLKWVKFEFEKCDLNVTTFLCLGKVK